jgi:hypothetical protein
MMALARNRPVRTLLAVLALVANGSFSTESVFGELRDGGVQHETVGAAASHASQSAGDHGHEDPESPDHDEHGPGHSHGSTSDHCTHQHGLAIPIELVFALTFSHTTTSFPDDVYLTGTDLPTLQRPPSQA